MAATADLILALDQGTTSCRALVYGLDGSVRASAQREFAQYFPRPGRVEHDAEQIWDCQLAVAREAIAETGADASAIAALGITNQRETVVLWERASGKPLQRAIVWQDRRTAEVTAGLRDEGHEKLIRSRTGLVCDPYFSATKIAWMLDRDPDLRRRAETGELAVGTIDSFLAWRLTGGARHITDVSNASRTMLYDIHRECWDDEMCDLLRVPRALLPEVVASAGELGTCTAELLGAEIPLRALIGDQQSALFGQGCWEPDMAKNTYGTGAFAMVQTGTAAVERAGALTTVAWRIGDEPTRYAVEGAVFVAGAAIQWLRDELGLLADAAESEALAREVVDTGGVVFVPALTGLATPHWDPHVRGALFGLTRGSTRAHLVRAALEGIAQSVTDAIAAMCDGAPSELRVDGGAANNDLLLQMQADLLGCPVRRPRDTETTVRGAAGLAALGAGLLGRDEVAAWWQDDRSLAPDGSALDASASRERWRLAVDCARRFPAEADDD